MTEMASAQVPSNSMNPSRKQDLLEAGKRRLEEYRKKKAADRAKKDASSRLTYVNDSRTDEKHALENGQADLFIFGDASTSSEHGDVPAAPARVVVEDAGRTYGFSHANELKPTYPSSANSPFPNKFDTLLSEPPKVVKDQEHLRDASMLVNETNANQYSNKVGNSSSHIPEGRHADGILSDKSNIVYQSISPDDSSSFYKPGNYGWAGAQTDESNGIPRTSLAVSSSIPDVENSSHQSSGSTLFQNKTDSVYSSNDFQVIAPEYDRSTYGLMDLKSNILSSMGQRKPTNSAENFSISLGDHIQVSKPPAKGFNIGTEASSSHAAAVLTSNETYTRRSRPSFLDVISIPRASSESVFAPQIVESAGVPSINVKESLPSEKAILQTGILEHPTKLGAQNVSGSFSENTVWGSSIDRNTEKKLEFHSQKQYEDFAALEQHIEDLTQERFSLQRAIEASKTLVESLSAENSSLTESYNQQASVVSQLKYEIEKLQKEINSHLGELELMKIQYTNAQLECGAADERAKLLASEVIGLEEKALRLRSNELKLEKELEKTNAELTSCKKKLSRLEKDRQDLQLTVDALQEEKKLLLSRLQKASTMGSSLKSVKTYPKKDVSTSTDDIGDEVPTLVHGDSEGSMPSTSNQEGHDGAASYLSDANISVETTAFGFESSPIIIPPDQLQLIQNIYSLSSELMAEKDELTRALAAEVSASSRLKDINKDLSHKLEVQTQRLELLTAQRLANENMLVATQPTNDHLTKDSVSYADEGDEVVERVLGWIMRLFPGGPSRRRSSKLL